jgi:predicted phosphodiesterase
VRIAALYDIHGNLPALEAVVRDVLAAQVDLVVVGGDVLPGPMVREPLDLLRRLPVPVAFLRGNGDREALAQLRGEGSTTLPAAVLDTIRWCARQLTPEHEAAMREWPETLRLAVPGVGEVLFCHATPRNDTEIFTRETPESDLLPVFGICGAPLVVCGHTHMQFDRRIGGVRVVNAGSVGMPFGDAGAYWLLLQPAVRLRRTTYDVEGAAARIRATAYPQGDAFARDNVLHPPAEAEMLARLGSVALR